MAFPRQIAPNGVSLEAISLPVTDGPGFSPGDDVGANSAGDWAISDNGRWVLFVSEGAMEAGDTNNDADAFLADRATGTIERISVGPGGAQIPEGSGVNGAPGRPGDDYVGISPDGIHAIFTTWDGGTGLVPDSPDASGFVHDRRDGAVSTVPYDRMDDIDVNGAGIFAFANAGGAYSYDPATGATAQLVDDPRNNYNIGAPDVSADGSVVAYTAWSFDGSIGYGNDLRLRLSDGTVVIPGRAADGSVEAGFSFHPSLSDDGNHLVFQTRDPRLVAGGDVDGAAHDVFLYDVAADSLTQITRAADGSDADNDSGAPTISNDGRYVGFDSNASNLPDSPGASERSAYVWDRLTGTVRRVDDWDIADRDRVSHFVEPASSEATRRSLLPTRTTPPTSMSRTCASPTLPTAWSCRTGPRR